jgi:hypothetical protein
VILLAVLVWQEPFKASKVVADAGRAIGWYRRLVENDCITGVTGAWLVAGDVWSRTMILVAVALWGGGRTGVQGVCGLPSGKVQDLNWGFGEAQ